MARTTIPTTQLGDYGKMVSCSEVVGDGANDHQFVNTGRELLLAKPTNDAAGSVTIEAVLPAGRTTAGEEKSKPLTIAPDSGFLTINVLGPFEPSAYNQPGTNLVHVNITSGTAGDVELVVIRPVSAE